MDRFDRNVRFFGAEGQRKLKKSHVAVVGCGGLGEIVIQQLAFLGVGRLTLIEDEELSASNLNRYVLARHDDPIPGTHKLDIAVRAVSAIDATIQMTAIRESLRSKRTFEALRDPDTFFGCLDNDGARLILNEYAKAYSKDYFDLATDVEDDHGLRFGGRVVHVDSTPGCLVCTEQLDLIAAREDLEGDRARLDRAKIYGVDAELLDEGGPSVVSINGVIASLAVTEYLLGATGIRKPQRVLAYRGDRGIVTVRNDMSPECYYCTTLGGAGGSAGVERYINEE